MRGGGGRLTSRKRDLWGWRGNLPRQKTSSAGRVLRGLPEEGTSSDKALVLSSGAEMRPEDEARLPRTELG